MSAAPSSSARHAVVTGLGVIAPNGIGLATWWQTILQGRSGIKRISRFDPSGYPIQYAGEVEGFQPEEMMDAHLLAQTDRSTQMAVAATQMALADAGLDLAKHDRTHLGLSLACAGGGAEVGQREMQNLWSKGPIFVGAYAAIASFYGTSAGQLSILHGIKGPSAVVAADGASGADALYQACRQVRRGVEVVVSGGTEAALTPLALASQMRSGRLSAVSGPDAYRPFDERASGYLPGEGGAVLLVEELEHARGRGVPYIYGEIAGFAATHDAHHYNRPAPDGQQLARAIVLALERAGLAPGAVDAIFADGAGTTEGDAVETRALRAVFGERISHLPVTVPKSMTGRLHATGAALDIAAALLSLRDSCLPPTIHVDRPVHHFGLDLVRGSPRYIPLQTVLIIARGFGGFNSATVIRRLNVESP